MRKTRVKKLREQLNAISYSQRISPTITGDGIVYKKSRKFRKLYKLEKSAK